MIGIEPEVCEIMYYQQGEDEMVVICLQNDIECFVRKADDFIGRLFLSMVSTL